MMNDDETPGDVVIRDEGPGGIVMIAGEDAFYDRVLPILFRFRISGRLAFDETAARDRSAGCRPAGVPAEG